MPKARYSDNLAILNQLSWRKREQHQSSAENWDLEFSG
jgi:hypothetical protein